MFNLKGVGLLLVSVMFFAGTALAQVTTGTILGTVSDSTGAVIPGATVTVRNVETGITRTLSTDATGRFRAPQLGLGNYEITAGAAGFQSLVRSGITLTVGREAVVNFTLQVGSVAERITVTGEAPLIETTNATVADSVSERELRSLPLNARSFTDLTAIQPGVVADIGLYPTVFSGGTRIVMNGARPTQSLYLLDGTDILSPATNVAPASVLGQALGVDTIREFTVLQNNYGAQYGRAIGGIVNSITRSGTNEFHGSAFEFLRNSKLDAKNYFDLAEEPIPPFQRNQFGGTLGGPIVRDNSFFFFSYEGVRENLGITDNATVMSDEARVGLVTNCPAGVTVCTREQALASGRNQLVPSIHPDIVPYINAIPRGTGRYRNDGLQEFRGHRVQRGRENYWMGRIDQKLSDNDNLFGRMVADWSSRELPEGQLLPDGRHTSMDDDGFYGFLTVEWSRILSSTTLNVARIGYARNNNQQVQTIAGTDTPAEEYPWPTPSPFEVVPGLPYGGLGAPNGVTVPGGANGPGAQGNINDDQNSPVKFVDNTYSVSDSLRYSKGRHSLDLGVDIRRFQMNADAGVWNRGSGSWHPPMANFLTGGQCSGCRGINSITTTSIKGPPDHYRGWRQTYAAWHVQDDFQLLSNLTLNLGVRWERVTAPTEVNGKVANIIDILRDGSWTQLKDQPLFKIRDGLKGFSPRFGFAYSPDSKTAIRGGFGVFTEIQLLYLYQLAYGYPPYADRGIFQNITKFPRPLEGVGLSDRNQPLVVSYDNKNPYAYQWNFGIERQLGEVWVAKVGYIGTRGLNIVGVLDQVQPRVQKDAAGEVFTPLRAPSQNPWLHSSRTYAPVSDSYYHALQLRLQRRFSQGLEFNTNYTWSKNTGTAGFGLKGAETRIGGGGSTASYHMVDLWNLKGLGKGPLDQHVPHNFTFSSTYDLPIGQGRSLGTNMGGAANAILGGWQVNLLFSARSGLPVSIAGPGYSNSNYCRTCTLRPNLKPGGDNNPVIGDVDLWFDASNFQTVRPGYYGNVGRNTLSTARLVKTDFSIFKLFPWGEGKDIQFRAEFFNLFNKVNLSRPNGSVFNTNGSVNSNIGRITSIVGTARQIQFALKMTF